MTHTTPLYRTGIAILVADLCAQARVEPKGRRGAELRFRIRLLHPSVMLTDGDLELYYDEVNRAFAPRPFRQAHAECLQILEHALESPANPNLDGDDVAA